jgi:Bacterial PH domain
MGSAPVGRKKRADAASGPQTFRSPTALVVWWVWLLFAVANLIDLAVQGRDHLSLVAAAILVLVTGVVYVTAQRPRVVADKAGLTVVNPLRDYHVGWARVSRVDLADLLRIHCDLGQGRSRVIHCWAVQFSRRRKFTSDAKARRQAARASSGRSTAGMFGLDRYGGGGRQLGYAAPPSGGGGGAAPSAEAEAERTVKVLSEYVNAARAEAVWAEGTVEIAGSPASAPADRELGPAGGDLAPADGELADRELEPADRKLELADGELEPAENAAARLGATGWLEPLTGSWSRTAILALLIPALLLVVAALV